MSVLLEDVFNGNVRRDPQIPDHSEYSRCSEVSLESQHKMEAFLDSLSKSETSKGNDLFRHYMNDESDWENVSAMNHFIEGLKFGVAFMVETLLVSHHGEESYVNKN